jgi:ABC-type transport system involved in cytochrome c biogenesis permease component
VIHSRLRALLLPVLLLPISVPLFLCAVMSSERVLAGAGSKDVVFWLEFLAGYIVIFITISVLLSDALFED